MKRWALLILAVLLVLGFAACAKKQEEKTFRLEEVFLPSMDLEKALAVLGKPAKEEIDEYYQENDGIDVMTYTYSDIVFEGVSGTLVVQYVEADAELKAIIWTGAYDDRDAYIEDRKTMMEAVKENAYFADSLNDEGDYFLTIKYRETGVYYWYVNGEGGGPTCVFEVRGGYVGASGQYALMVRLYGSNNAPDIGAQD